MQKDMKHNNKKRTGLMKKRIEAKYLVLTVGAFLALLVVMLVPMLEGGDIQPESDLRLQRVMPLLLENENSGHNLTKATVTVVVYVTNMGHKDSGTFSMDIYAEESTSGMSYDRDTWTCASIKKKHTAKGELTLYLPVGYTYHIRLLGMEDTYLILEGVGTIRLKTEGGVYSNPFQTTYRGSENSWNPYDGDKGASPSSGNVAKEMSSSDNFIGLICLLLPAVLIIGVIVYAVKKAKAPIKPALQYDQQAYTQWNATVMKDAKAVNNNRNIRGTEDTGREQP